MITQTTENLIEPHPQLLLFLLQNELLLFIINFMVIFSSFFFSALLNIYVSPKYINYLWFGAFKMISYYMVKLCYLILFHKKNFYVRESYVLKCITQMYLSSPLCIILFFPHYSQLFFLIEEK